MKALFTFGRFQPPTVGHKVLIDFIAETAAAQGADPYVFVSSTQNKSRTAKPIFESTKANENPLSVYDKVKYLNKMYPDTPVKIINTTESECTTIFQIVDKLRSNGYTEITMAVGSDRVESFQKILSRVGVNIIPAGVPRTVNANSSNVKAMSGTKMRIAAVSGNIEKFKEGVLIGSMTEADALDLLNLVRQGLGYDVLYQGGALRNRTQRRIKIKRHRKSRRYVLRLEERT